MGCDKVVGCAALEVVGRARPECGDCGRRRRGFPCEVEGLGEGRRRRGRAKKEREGGKKERSGVRGGAPGKFHFYLTSRPPGVLWASFLNSAHRDLPAGRFSAGLDSGAQGSGHRQPRRRKAYYSRFKNLLTSYSRAQTGRGAALPTHEGQQWFREVRL